MAEYATDPLTAGPIIWPEKYSQVPGKKMNGQALF